ncbi:MAG: hypothetical protein AB8G16_13825 [Gammaproteobacteria bacterium]
MDSIKNILRFSIQSSLLGALAIITLLFGLSTLGLNMASMIGMAGIVVMLAALFIGFVAIVGTIGYSFVVFRAAANGRRVVRPVTADEFRTLWSRRFASFVALIAVLIYVSIKLRDVLPAPYGELITSVLLLLVPASMSLMLLNESLAQAINPVLQLRVARELGAPYFLLPLCFGVALIVAGFIFSRSWGWPWTAAAICYVWFLSAQLAGRVIYTFHDRVGFEPNNDDLMRAAEDARLEQIDINEIMDKAFAHGRTNSQRALSEIESLFTGEHDTLEFREKILRQVQTWPNPMVGLRLEQSLITRALALGEETLAFELVLDGMQRNPAFRPAGPNATLKVAAIAKTRARPRIVTALLSDFWARFEDHPQRAAAALMCARVAIEKTNEPELAQVQLERLDQLKKTRNNPQVQTLKEALNQQNRRNSLT